MKILVAVKQVALLEDEVEFVDDGAAVDPDFLEWSLNEWDAFANEAAIRLREKAGEGEVEVVVVTVGGDEADEALRRCLAVGADRAIRVDAEALDPIAIAHALAAVVRDEAPEVVLCGVQSSDSAQGATGAALAGLLDWPIATVVTDVDWDFGGEMTVRRELEGGVVETLALDLPAVLTVQTGTNELRYASLRQIKQAEALPIDHHDAAPDGKRGYTVDAMRKPARVAAASPIEGSPAEIAGQILELVKIGRA
jgi:electron transfer flavoprotein beta subunit